jgi:hypothetical protein
VCRVCPDMVTALGVGPMVRPGGQLCQALWTSAVKTQVWWRYVVGFIAADLLGQSSCEKSYTSAPCL